MLSAATQKRENWRSFGGGDMNGIFLVFGEMGIWSMELEREELKMRYWDWEKGNGSGGKMVNMGGLLMMMIFELWCCSEMVS